MQVLKPRGKVLLVEDEPAHATLIAEALRSLAAEVEHVGTATAALGALTERRFDLVVLDIGLPDMSGVAMLAAMRARGDATPVICVTVDDAPERRLEAMRQGAVEHVVKRPGYLAAVASAARHVLAGPRPRGHSG